ncbi:MAG TPA: hypothetical protein VFQ71_10400 [Gaiellales bacterium]|nr:hypothetical protein [Gaiellales bacterium]
MAVDAGSPSGRAPAPDPAAAAIADWRRWGPALEEWARASRGAQEPERVVAVAPAWPLIERDRAPLATSVGTG